MLDNSQQNLNKANVARTICRRENVFRMRTRLTQCLVIACLGHCSYSAAGDNWSSFQNGGLVSLSSQTEISEKPEWTIDLPGYGQSSPVTWNGNLYVTCVSGENKEKLHVAAYQLEDGERLWTYATSNATPQESSNYISRAAPTPVVDENGVIAFFEGGNLIALDHKGEVRWQRNLVEEYGAIDARHGLASSLEQTDNAVFVWVERQTEPYLVSINKQSGENQWRVEGLGVTSWSSPRLIPVEGTKQLVLSGSGLIVGFNPESGDRLWSFDDVSGNTTPTPIPIEEGRFLIGASVGRGSTDTGRAAKSNGVVEISKTDDGTWKANFVWQSKRATTSFGSPVVADGQCYFVNRSGVMYCLDAETGEEQYAERIGGSIWATPIASDGQLILPLKDGKLVVASAGKEFQSRSEFEVFEKKTSNDNPFEGETLYAAIVTNNQLIVRSGSKLYSFLVN